MAEDMFEQLLRRTREDYDSLGIPVTEGEVTVEEMMLPMPDGVELKTYLFHMAQDDLWEGARSFPVILQRSPYFHAMDSYRLHGAELAKEASSTLSSAAAAQANRRARGNQTSMRGRTGCARSGGWQSNAG